MYTRLKGITRLTDSTISEQLIDNISDFFEWGILCIGGFINSNNEKLLPTGTSTTTAIWQAKRPRWVWEDNIPFDYQPIYVNNIKVNGTVIPNDGSVYKISYREGQIIFLAPIASTSDVRVSYSYKLVNFYDSDADWFQTIMFDPMSEEYVKNNLTKNKIYLPCVIIEQIPVRSFAPVQLGDLSQNMSQDILFHVLSDTDEMRNKLIDALTLQQERTIWLYDNNKIAQDNAFQYFTNGTLKPNALTYPNIVEAYKWKKCRIANMVSQEVDTSFPLSRAIIRGTFEVFVR